MAGGDHPTLYCLANQLVSLETKELGAYEAAEVAQLEDAKKEKELFIPMVIFIIRFGFQIGKKVI